MNSITDKYVCVNSALFFIQEALGEEDISHNPQGTEV